MWGAAPRAARIIALFSVAVATTFACLQSSDTASATRASAGAISDFNADGRSDYAVFRPANGMWYVNGGSGVLWGSSGDVPVPGDYNGDRRTDIGVFRPANGTWYVNGVTTMGWGAVGDIPVPGDYKGNSKTDIGVFRPSNGTWYIRGVATMRWGAPGDIPVPGDYDGKGKTDIAVFRPSNGTWYINGVATMQWGAPGDIPVPGDYNGDGKTDIAVFRPSNGTWYVYGVMTIVWGTSSDVPAPGDYNGDGKTDAAYWRPSTGAWWIYNNSAPSFTLGSNGDIPIRIGVAEETAISLPPPPPDTTPPGPVPSFQMTGATQTTIGVSWLPASDNVDVAGYNLYRDGVKVGTTTSLSYSFTGLTCGTTYALAVEAFDSAGNVSNRALSSINQATSGCGDATPPSAPTNLQVTGSAQTSISVSWTASTDNVGVSGYGKYANNSLVTSGAGTTYTFGSLNCATSYNLAVDAYDAAGNRSAKTTISASTAACPTGGSGSAPPYRFMINSDQGGQAAANYGYNLLDVGSAAEANDLPAGTQGLIWVGDYNNSSCSFEQSDATVRATATAGVNDPKVFGYYISDEPDPFACPNAYNDHRARSNLIHSIDPGHKTLILIDSNSAQQTLDQIPRWAGTADLFALDPYPCYQGEACNYGWIDQVIAAANSAGINYWGVAQAFQDPIWRWPTVAELNHMLGQWAASKETGIMTFAWTWSGNTITNQPALLDALKTFNTGASVPPLPPPPSDTTAPSTPTNFVVTGTTSSSISVSWSASTDNVGVTSYGLYKGGTLVGSASGTTTTFNGLPCNTSQTLAVDAADLAGNRSGKATVTASTAACPSDTTPPSTPSGLRVTGSTQTSVALSWTASTDNVGVTGYNVFRGTTVDGTSATTTYTASSLSCGTSYTFTVQAKDAAGNVSAQSGSVSGSTAACPSGDTTPPSTPSGLRVTGSTQTSVALSWTASTDNVGVTGYNVFRGTTVDGTSATTTYTASSLSCGTSYTFTVQAKDGAGNVSAQSGSVSGSTAACPSGDTTPPSTPANLAVTSSSQTAISLSWNASTDNVGVTGYNVFRGTTVDGTSATTTYTASSLSCGTSYTFTVQAKDGAGNVSAQSGSVNGTTAACGGGATDAVITAAGDICGSSTDCRPTSDLVLSINPTRALTLGDNAYDVGSTSEFSTEYDPNWGRFKANTSPSPGNHDYDTAGATGYFSYFGSVAPAPYYSFDLGAWHLISLASSSGIDPGAGSAEETWLKQDLAAHTNKCILAYWHEPRWSSGTVHGSNSDWNAVWNDLYAAHADVVLNGHEHNYERFGKQNPSGAADANGIREIIAGTGGASHGYPFGTPIANSEVRNDNTWGVLKLTLHPTSYDWQFVPIPGSTFTDSGSDTCS